MEKISFKNKFKTTTFYYIPIRMTKSKRLTISSVDADLQELKFPTL